MVFKLCQYIPQTYEGHTHYIMNIAVNPKDTNTFASSCLDRTIKMWNIGSPTPNYTMDAHDMGVNYVDFYPGADKPYLVTTGDDKTVKVWDYLSKSCVQTMEGHTNNVSFAVFHPNLPIIISGSEDGTVKIWNSGTYRLENTLSYALERAWCVALSRKANEVAVGYDEGIVVIKVLPFSPFCMIFADFYCSSVGTNRHSAWIPLANSSIPKTKRFSLRTYKRCRMTRPQKARGYQSPSRRWPRPRPRRLSGAPAPTQVRRWFARDEMSREPRGW